MCKIRDLQGGQNYFVASCSLVYLHQRVEGIYCLLLHCCVFIRDVGRYL